MIGSLYSRGAIHSYSEYEEFIRRIRPTVYTAVNPVIINDGTYINTCPGGIITDPSDSSKIIFYKGEFLGPSSIGARIRAYSASKSNIYSFTDLGPVLVGTPATSDVNGCRFGMDPIFHNGVYYYYYVGIDSLNKWRIFLATTTDGLTFTKQGLVLDFDNVLEKSLSGPSVYKDGNTWYMAYTVWDGIGGTDNNPGDSKGGIKIATSTDLFNWTKTGVTIVPLGTGSQPDSDNVEDGKLFKLGSRWVFCYNGHNENPQIWSICMAWSDDINVPFVKYGIMYQHNNTLAACPIFYPDADGVLNMYYQTATSGGGSGGINDIYVSRFLLNI